MSMRNRLTALLWLLGAAAALGLSLLWVLAAQDGKVSGFALVPFMWSVALLAGCVHHFRHAHEPSAEGQPGALLPQ